jgi:hypothetical protein
MGHMARREISAARHGGLVACALVCALFGRASAAELPLEVATARTGPLHVTFVLAKAPATWSRELRIAVAAGTSALTTGLTFDDVLLETETGVRATAAVTRPPGTFPLELAAGQTATVTLSATFTTRGLYRGELVLRQGDRRRVVPLEINVTAPGGAPLEPEGGHSVAITESIFDDGNVSAVLQLRNKGRDPVMLRSVDLASATRVDRPVSPEMILQSPSARLSAQGSGPAIEPGAVARVPIEVAGLAEPGIYLVHVTVQAEGQEPAQITVTVYRREHWLWAILAITVGAIAAWSVRAFTTRGRDRREPRLQLAVLHAVVIIVAIASGMKALWIGNPTWGTDHAWLIALLWGVGIGAIGDAFTGLIRRREKPDAPRTPDSAAS